GPRIGSPRAAGRADDRLGAPTPRGARRDRGPLGQPTDGARRGRADPSPALRPRRAERRQERRLRDRRGLARPRRIRLRDLRPGHDRCRPQAERIGAQGRAGPSARGARAGDRTDVRSRMTRILEADLTWTGERFEAGIRITIGDDGRIAGIATQDADATHAEIPVERLRGRALLPGFVNGHSHAFQRGLRGLGERFPAGAGNFWTWREAMYDLVERMDEERIHTLSLQAFREMRAAGVTTVGEFHYLHHRGPGADFAFDEAILAAAEAAGIRLVLLETYYQTGGIGLPLGPAQRRFEGVSPGVYWRQVDALEAKLGPRQSLGGVVHSVRAAGLDELAEIYVETRRRGLPFHIHVEEQVKEVEDCRAAYGKTPMAAVLDACGGAEGMTAI